MLKRLTPFILFCLLGHTTGMAQMLSLRTNLLWDALEAPSLGMEISTGNSTSLGLNISYARHPLYAKSSRIILVQPEWRYYLSRRTMHGTYMGIGAVGADYDLQWKGKRYNGDAAGAGFTVGCMVTLASRLNLDLHAGVGAVAYRQKEYYEGDNYNDYSLNSNVKTNANGYALLPTDFGITLSYILK